MDLRGDFGDPTRLAREEAEGADTHYFLFNLGLTVPTTESCLLSVGLSLPLAGDRPALLTLGSDISLLLGGK